MSPHEKDLLETVYQDLLQNLDTGLLLAEVDEDEHLPDLRHRLAVIRQQFQHATELVALLGGGEPSPSVRADLGQLVARAVDAARAGALVFFDVEDGDHAVTADPVQLRRAFDHLLDNACRAASCEVRVRVGGNGDEHWVEVSDDGPGFARTLAGTGRGLLGVRQAVRATGGQLHISGRQDGGTTMRLSFPIS